MSIQPINSVSGAFKGKIKTTDKGNTYETSNIGKGIGLVSGLAIAGALMHSQVSALKTISGKKNLIEGFHVRGKSLNDVISDFEYKWDFKVKNAFRNTSRMSVRRIRACITVLRDTAFKLNSSAADPKILIEEAVTQMLAVKN